MWRKGCNGVCFNGSCLFFPFIFHPWEFAACSYGIYGLQRSHTFDSFPLLWDGLYNRGVLLAGLFLPCFVLLLKPGSTSFGVRYCFPTFLFFPYLVLLEIGERMRRAGMGWIDVDGSRIGKVQVTEWCIVGSSTWFASKSSVPAVSCSYSL